MKISVLSLFPEYFQGMLQTSVISRAFQNGLFEFETVNFRDFTKSKHGHVDDTPYGGGAGMVLACQPLLDALKSIRKENSKVILLSPQGQKFTQKKAQELAEEEHLILICGHYEGFDERIRAYADEQLSLGDFVLTGGEPAAAAMCDSILRLVPGVIRAESSGSDSFSDGLLEYPQYTRPYEYEGVRVPDILLSGHHANIEKWRHEQSLYRTWKYRPELLSALSLSAEDSRLIEQWEKETRTADPHDSLQTGSASSGSQTDCPVSENSEELQAQSAENGCFSEPSAD